MLKIAAIFLVAIAATELRPADERPQVLCGRILADARMIYCLSTEKVQKKSDDTYERYANDDVYDESSKASAASWPWMANRLRVQALKILGRHKRETGLVDECCYKPCYISEVLNYC